jgi:hypothetical protein
MLCCMLALQKHKPPFYFYRNTGNYKVNISTAIKRYYCVGCTKYQNWWQTSKAYFPTNAMLKCRGWFQTIYFDQEIYIYIYIYIHIQGDQKVSVHLMITIQKVTSNFQSAPTNFQGHGDTKLTLTLSVIPNSNYVIMVSELNCLKYFCVFFVL